MFSKIWIGTSYININFSIMIDVLDKSFSSRNFLDNEQYQSKENISLFEATFVDSNSFTDKAK